MKTLSEQFVDSRKQRWSDLRQYTEKLNSPGGTKKMTAEEVQEFPRLYRLCCGDLAEARMRQLSPDILEYLNGLVGTAHSCLYYKPVLRLSNIKGFFTQTLMHSLSKSWKYFITALLLFYGSMGITFAVIRINPETANTILSEDVRQMMVESYIVSPGESGYESTRQLMATYYIQHNTSIGFYCFAGGLLFGLGSIFFLLYNGIQLGAVFAYITNVGFGSNILNFITAHGPAELTAIVISGAAGLLLGHSVALSLRNQRLAPLKQRQNQILTMVGGAVLLFFMAALIEGNLSPRPIPYFIKLMTAILTGSGILFYFFILPFYLKHRETVL